MIERYMLPEMASVWSEESRYRNWAKVEQAHIMSLRDNGIIEDGAEDLVNRIQSDIDYINPNMIRAKEIEKETKHDLAAFVDAISDDVPDGQWIHFGLTSSDVVDTAFALQLAEASELIHDTLSDFEDVLYDMAYEYKNTPIMGRTHGMHAEPTTFALIMLNYYREFLRHLDRLNHAIDNIKVL